MPGREAASANLFSYVRLEDRVPPDHPLRPIRALADEVLAGLNDRFESLYSEMGRPSIPPEMLLRATLLKALFSVRSERMLMEQIDDNLLFRWFVGLEIDAPVWHPTGFPHNRDRFLETDAARTFLSGLLALKPVKRLLSSDHLSVDEELPAQGRFGRAAGAGPQRRTRLPQGEALERDPCLDHRPGRGAPGRFRRRAAGAGSIAGARCRTPR